MTDAPRISVVTPSFNQHDFVEATLRSVVDQAYPNLEYVVVDGGSTDGSVDVIRRYEERLSSWVSEPDNGHAHALNKGFARTTGDIMCWINSSDVHYPWTLETVSRVFTELPHVDWIMGIPSQFDAAGGPRHVSPGPGFNVYDFLAGDYRWIQQESVFWRRSLWERAGGRLDEGLRCAADFDLWLRFFRLAPLCRVQTVLAGFRVHEESLGGSGNGLYERETAELFSRFKAGFDGRMLRRARLVHAIGAGRRKVAGEALNRVGLWPWYRHPRISFDFAEGRWVLR
jgi:glycosyltransferase involved in cell wall biosynthesis